MKWSIVMPVYNEAAIIETVVKSFEENILERLPSSEFIVVNDKSTDNTGAILDQLAKRYSNLRVIHAEKNGGHGAALLKAYEAAKGAFVFHCDSDNQHDPLEFWALERYSETHDVVLGVRTQRHDPLNRRIITRINRLICRLLFGSTIRDHNTPFKIYSRKALTSVLAIVSPRHPFAPSIEMALTARVLGLKIAEVPVTHLPRRTGTISIVRMRLLKACVRTASELFALRKQLQGVARA